MKQKRLDPCLPPDLNDHRPLRCALRILGYDAATKTVDAELDVVCEPGLRRILTQEGYQVVGPVDGYCDYTHVVENLYGRYMVAFTAGA